MIEISESAQNWNNQSCYRESCNIDKIVTALDCFENFRRYIV